MEILLLVFFIGAVGLAFYAFSPEKSKQQQLEKLGEHFCRDAKFCVSTGSKCESCVVQKELDEVKKKLENAEQVLRMVHGTNY